MTSVRAMEENATISRDKLDKMNRKMQREIQELRLQSEMEANAKKRLEAEVLKQEEAVKKMKNQMKEETTNLQENSQVAQDLRCQVDELKQLLLARDNEVDTLKLEQTSLQQKASQYGVCY